MRKSLLDGTNPLMTAGLIEISSDKLPSLSSDQANALASRFDFSGGEIDNIVRKSLMAEVLEGTAPSFGEIEKLCTEEKIGRAGGKSVGFITPCA